MDLAQIDRLQDAWNCAAVDAERMDAAVEATARAVNSHCAVMTTPVADPMRRYPRAAYGMSDDDLSVYGDHYVAINPWLEAGVARGLRLTAGGVHTGRTVLSHEGVESSRFYREFGQRYGMHEVVAMHVCDDEDPVAPVTRLALFRAAGQPLFTPADESLLRSLWPVVQRAVRMRWRLAHHAPPAGMVPATLDGMPHPMMVLRQDGRIDFSNRAARGAHDGWLEVTDGRLLRVGNSDPTAWLRSIHLPTPGVWPAWPVSRQVDGHLMRATVRMSDIREHPAYVRTWPNAIALLTLELPPRTSVGDLVERFAQRFRLSPAEAKLMHWLADGSELTAAGAHLGVAYGTARAQLRSVLQKTGAARQTELLGLLLRGDAPAP